MLRKDDSRQRSRGIVLISCVDLGLDVVEVKVGWDLDAIFLAYLQDKQKDPQGPILT